VGAGEVEGVGHCVAPGGEESVLDGHFPIVCHPGR
jgi:hypothetical protein